jgi:hypothetical protein
MADYERSELEDAFRTYFLTGPVHENWAAWAELFTDDAIYHDHFWGTFRGPGEILEWIEGVLAGGPQAYTVLSWYVIGTDRVVYEAINRSDNPQVGAPPIDFTSLQVVTYAGGGKWCAEDDWWILRESKRWGEEYAAAAARFDPEHASKMTRLDWGPIDWARPEPGAVGQPSWLKRDDLVSFQGLRDIHVGTRNP